MLFFFYSVNVSQFILAKLAAKLVMPVGNSTALNMVSSPMDKCHLTKPLEPETIPSTPSSQRLAQASISISSPDRSSFLFCSRLK